MRIHIANYLSTNGMEERSLISKPRWILQCENSEMPELNQRGEDQQFFNQQWITVEFILLKPAGADKSPAEINYWEGWMQREECSYLCDNCKWQEEHQWEHRAIAWISAGDQQHPHQIPSTSPRYLTRNYLEACVFLQTRNT